MDKKKIKTFSNSKFIHDIFGLEDYTKLYSKEKQKKNLIVVKYNETVFFNNKITINNKDQNNNNVFTMDKVINNILNPANTNNSKVTKRRNYRQILKKSHTNKELNKDNEETEPSSKNIIKPKNQSEIKTKEVNVNVDDENVEENDEASVNQIRKSQGLNDKNITSLKKKKSTKPDDVNINIDLSSSSNVDNGQNNLPKLRNANKSSQENSNSSLPKAKNVGVNTNIKIENNEEKINSPNSKNKNNNSNIQQNKNDKTKTVNNQEQNYIHSNSAKIPNPPTKALSDKNLIDKNVTFNSSGKKTNCVSHNSDNDLKKSMSFNNSNTNNTNNNSNNNNNDSPNDDKNMLLFIPCMNCGNSIPFDEIEKHSLICTKVSEELLKNEKNNYDCYLINYKLNKLKEHLNDINSCKIKVPQNIEKEMMYICTVLLQYIDDCLILDKFDGNSINELQKILKNLQFLSVNYKSYFSLLLLIERTKVLVKEKTKIFLICLRDKKNDIMKLKTKKSFQSEEINKNLEEQRKLLERMKQETELEKNKVNNLRKSATPLNKPSNLSLIQAGFYFNKQQDNNNMYNTQIISNLNNANGSNSNNNNSNNLEKMKELKIELNKKDRKISSNKPPSNKDISQDSNKEVNNINTNTNINIQVPVSVSTSDVTLNKKLNLRSRKQEKSYSPEPSDNKLNPNNDNNNNNTLKINNNNNKHSNSDNKIDSKIPHDEIKPETFESLPFLLADNPNLDDSENSNNSQGKLNEIISDVDNNEKGISLNTSMSNMSNFGSNNLDDAFRNSDGCNNLNVYKELNMEYIQNKLKNNLGDSDDNKVKRRLFYNAVFKIQMEKLHNTHKGIKISPKLVYMEAMKYQVPEEQWDKFILNELNNPIKYLNMDKKIKSLKRREPTMAVINEEEN